MAVNRPPLNDYEAVEKRKRLFGEHVHCVMRSSALRLLAGEPDALMSARPGPSRGYHASDIPTGISSSIKKRNSAHPANMVGLLKGIPFRRVESSGSAPCQTSNLHELKSGPFLAELDSTEGWTATLGSYLGDSPNPS